MKTLDRVFETVDAHPTVGAYRSASRQVGRAAFGLPEIRIALLASYTIDALSPFLIVETARHGFRPQVRIARFNTVRQELLDPMSECVSFAPDVVFVSERLDDVCPELGEQWTVREADEVTALIDGTVAALSAAIAAFRRRSASAVVVHNFTPPRYPAMGLCDSACATSQLESIARLNRAMGLSLPSLPGVYVLDTACVASRIGLDAWYDERLWLMARAPLSAVAMTALARAQATYVRMLNAPPRKVLALDLDNTLWGGVVGDLGVAGVALGPDFPGSAFVQFQQFVLSLYHRGVLLVLLSKNNQADVDEMFARHRSMVLRPEHFAAARINWQPKSVNIASVAEELGLGVDSFVFVDDDATECAWMRASQPEVLTIQVPGDVTKMRAAIIDSAAFERLALTAEDRGRGAMYAAATVRRRAEAAAASVDDFLDSLEMTAEVRVLSDAQVPRAADLLAKTNQFNLTTRRHSAAALAAMRAKGDTEVFTLQLRDRFGDNGLVGLAIVRRHNGDAVIDTLLLSCRVIGRRAETALLAHISEWARAQGISTLIGEFIPTLRNAPAADCYPRHGFEPLPGDGDLKRWRLAVGTAVVPWPSCIASGVSSLA